MSSTGVTAYPLAWPSGWPRTPADRREDSRYRFKTGGAGGGAVTFDVARRKLCDELDRMGATDVVISTGIPLRADGFPRAEYRVDWDPGVAIYFKRKGRPLVMAMDRFDRPSANIRSLGLAIEGMRQLERHGGGAMMERAFEGFTALPRAKSCWEILGIPPGSDVQSIKAAHKGLVIDNAHDEKGSDENLAVINGARDRALEEIGARERTS